MMNSWRTTDEQPVQMSARWHGTSWLDFCISQSTLVVTSGVKTHFSGKERDRNDMRIKVEHPHYASWFIYGYTGVPVLITLISLQRRYWVQHVLQSHTVKITESNYLNKALTVLIQFVFPLLLIDWLSEISPLDASLTSGPCSRLQFHPQLLRKICRGSHSGFSVPVQ